MVGNLVLDFCEIGQLSGSTHSENRRQFFDEQVFYGRMHFVGRGGSEMEVADYDVHDD